MNVAVIGCGHIFQIGHGPALSKYQKDYRDLCLYAGCDVNNKMTDKAQRKYGFKHTFDSVDRMLEEARPDAIILCLPTKYITEVAVKLLKEKICIPFLIILHKIHTDSIIHITIVRVRWVMEFLKSGMYYQN